MNQSQPPLLLIDVDGVISLFGFDPATPPAGHWMLVEGIPHLISAVAGREIRRLADAFELVWCTGWEEKANDHLLGPLGLAGPLPVIHFDKPGRLRESPPGEEMTGAEGLSPTRRSRPGHWKLAAIDAFAGPNRPLAWIDDRLDATCERWAAARSGPTLLVRTDAPIGLVARHGTELTGWNEGQTDSSASVHPARTRPREPHP